MMFQVARRQTCFVSFNFAFLFLNCLLSCLIFVFPQIAPATAIVTSNNTGIWVATLVEGAMFESLGGLRSPWAGELLGMQLTSFVCAKQTQLKGNQK